MTGSETTSTSPPAEPDERIRVRRVPDRASYSRSTVNSILDDGLVAHVGTIRDGAPFVIPMFYVRDGDSLLLHGAPAAGTIRKGAGIELCVTVTLVDGLVLARSAFHHSMNYRSVVIVGEGEAITDREEKVAALDHFVEVLVPGRTEDLRPMTAKEVNGTGVLRLSLEQASAKIRTGDPVDDDDDYALPIWAGVVPVMGTYGPPIDDARLGPGIQVPANVEALTQLS